MKITIVGAGNVGTQFAVHCSSKGHEVTVFTSQPEKIKKQLCIVDKNNEQYLHGSIEIATSNEQIAFKDAELIFVTVPAMLMEQMAKKIEPFVNSKMKICLVPGTGGGECTFKKCIDKGVVLFGLQRVPSVARLIEYGEIVRAIGYREQLHVAAIPYKYTGECCKIIQSIFDLQCLPLSNYLNITLTPSNPILHTTRLKNIYEEYNNSMVYESVPLFYEEWNDETSELLLACDAEVQDICKALKQFDLSDVISLKIHYDSQNASLLTNKIKSIDGFKGITSPAIKIDDGYIPDFNSRYFLADFSYGLTILVQIAEFIGINTPNLKSTLEWYNHLVGEHKEFRFIDYGICNYNDFATFYSI